MTASFEPTTNDTGPPLPNPTPVVRVIRSSAICSRTTEPGPRPNSSQPPVSPSSSESANEMATTGDVAGADAVDVRDAGAAPGLQPLAIGEMPGLVSIHTAHPRPRAESARSACATRNRQVDYVWSGHAAASLRRAR